MRLINADELITAFPCGESVRTESVRATINHMPTIEVSEDDLYIPLNNQTVERINRLHKDECGEYFDEEWLFNELEQIAEFRTVSEEKVGISQETSTLEDAISRTKLKEDLEAWAMNLAIKNMLVKDDVFVVIDNAPSVTTEQSSMVGEWKHDGSDWENRWICSECGYKLFEERTNFYPNCGSKMKGADDE